MIFLARFKKIALYIVSGGTAGVVNLIVLYILTEYGHVYYVASEAFAFSAAFFVSFGMQKFLTFKDRSVSRVHAQLGRYLIVMLANLASNTALLFLLVRYGHVWYVLAELAVTALLACVSYFIYQHWIFSAAPQDQHAVGAASFDFEQIRRRAGRVALPVIVVAIGILSLGGLYLAGVLTQPVYPITIDDDVYYLARMNTVANGYPNVGNPFYFEHRFDAPVSFNVPDIVTALPRLFGASVAWTIVFNFFVWSEIAALLAYAIFRAMRFDSAGAALGALFVYAESYMLLWRSDAMQLVFPLFFAVILGVILIESDGMRQRLGWWFLMAATAASFYFYTYLWQIVGATMLVLCGVYYRRGDWTRCMLLISVGIASLIAAIPTLLMQARQFSDPVYIQTTHRISLALTHWPTIEEYYYGRWALIVMAAWWLLRRHISASRAADSLMYGLGFGLVIANWNNLITGVEIETGEHIGKFIAAYAAFAAILFVRMLATRGIWRAASRSASMWLALILLALLGANLVASLGRAVPWRHLISHDDGPYERLAGPLRWLDEHTAAGTIILSDDLLAVYIPMYTRDYDLYAQSGTLQYATDEEIMDRYALSRAIRAQVSDQELLADSHAYLGAGVMDRLNEQNQEAQWCRSFRLDIAFGMWCPAYESLQQHLGPAFLEALHSRIRDDQAHLSEELAAYHVAYIAWPDSDVSRLDVSVVAHEPIVYDDGSYRIYELATP